MRNLLSLAALCSLLASCGYNPKASQGDAGGGGAMGGSVASEIGIDGAAGAPGIEAGAGGVDGLGPKKDVGTGVSDAGGADGKADVASAMPDASDVPIIGTGGTGGLGGIVETGGFAGTATGGTVGAAGSTATGGTVVDSGIGGASGIGGTGGSSVLLPAPVISSFSALPTTITAGKSSTLSWATSGATRLSIDQSVGVVSGSTAVTVAPAKTTSYTLTAENAAGVSVTKEVTVTVVSLPTISRFTITPDVISAGSKATINVAFTDGAQASIDNGVGTTLDGASFQVGPVSPTTTYTLTVTNAAGDSKTAKATVTVVPLPTISVFKVDLTPIAAGSSAMLTTTFADGIGSVDQNIGSVSSGNTISTGPLSAATTYTLTVTNPAGDKKTASVTVVAVSPGNFGIVPTVARPGGAHTATLLKNGKVLVTGGMSDRSGHAELYDPATETFSVTGSMAGSRYRHSATLLANGKVLVCGGIAGDGSYRAPAELYDPATGTFTGTGSMITARAYQAAMLLPDGTVLVTNGQGADGSLRSGELYDPGTGTFKAISSPLPNGYTDQTELSVPTTPAKFLILGGNSSREIYSYDPAAQTFSSAGGTYSLRTWPGIALMANNKVLMAGGVNPDNNVLKSAEVYDPASQTPVLTGDMTVARWSPIAVLLDDGQVLITGGQGQNNVLASAERYNPTTGVFTATGSMGVPRALHTATALPNRKVLIVGGNTDNTDPGAELYFY